MAPERGGPPSYEAMLAALPAFFAHITLEGKLLYLNRFAPGFTEAQIRDASIFDFTSPAYHPAMRACLEKVVATGEQEGFANLGQGAHGVLVPYYTLIAPIVEGGRVASLALLATDVSHVARAHLDHETTERKLQLALDATGMGTWTYDPVRRETWWDARLSAIHGYEAAARNVPNDQVITHLYPQDAARVREAAARVGADGSYGPIEHRIVRTDGSIRWVLAIGRIDPASGNTTGGALDITARKAQEERLAQAQKLDSIGRLAGGIAHDFNNMLTAILGYAELCIRRVPAGNPMVEDLREIRQAAERSRELTSRLLTFARKQRVEQRVVNTNAVVEHLERLLRRVVGEDVILTVNAHATRNVWIDPHQLEQLIVNLVTNARDAMPSGGELAIETADVEIEEADGDLAPGPHVLIRVVDTGTGIEPELLAHIFEPFFTTKEAGKGTGLGLAQCYGIAQQARGRLRVASTLGVGTRVTLELPAVAEPETAYGDAPGANRGGSETLLLVEDEAMIRALTVRILRDAGYRVLEADNGATALAVARAHDGTIDLLVTDMVIPGMTGAELVAQLRRERPGLAAVVMSGYAPQATSDLGAVTFLAKPFLPDELLATIHAVLTR